MALLTEINETTVQAYFERLDPLVRPGSGADLVASKLYRYSDQDQEDIQFLMLRGGVTLEAVRESVARLPERFREDVMTVENLGNLERDLTMWRGAK